MCTGRERGKQMFWEGGRCKKVNSYIVQYPVLWTAQSTLHFTHWQTCSFQRYLNFSGKHSAKLQLLREDFAQISTYVCSQVLIYTAE